MPKGSLVVLVLVTKVAIVEWIFFISILTIPRHCFSTGICFRNLVRPFGSCKKPHLLVHNVHKW